MTPARSSRGWPLAIGGLGFVLVAACHQRPLPAPDLVARIGTAQVRYPEFQSFVARTAGGSGDALGTEVLSQLFDQFLDERLLVELATDEKLIPQGASPRTAIDALLSREDGGPAVDEAKIEAYYLAHPAEFSRPESVRLRQILTQDRTTAERARAEIEKGAGFAEVARSLSNQPATAAGGYQEEMSRSDLPPAFADVIFRLRSGEVSPVIPADYGFHLFQVIEFLPAEHISQPQARSQILARLRRERADRELKRWVENSRARYSVEIYQHNLPFLYEGAYRNAQTER
jgi:parvulin-like peptidyl-prolyl isomerase